LASRLFLLSLRLREDVLLVLIGMMNSRVCFSTYGTNLLLPN
jgi:hypothetical protein